MCGIFGAIKLNGYFSEDDLVNFTASTDAVSYRGPDAAGYIAIDSFSGAVSRRKHHLEGKYNIFLGHRRLSIIGLDESCNQPMENSNNFIVYNGEIFNYIELRKELQEKGVKFATNSDTEVILQIYKLYGSKAFSMFNGMWAIIIVDLNNRKIIVSRDRFSIKPLYYHINSNSFYFASEIKQLLPFLSDRKLTNHLMTSFLSRSVLDHSENTFFDQILKVPAKTNMIIDLSWNCYKFEKYWEYSYEEIPSGVEIFEKFRELITDSVKIRLRGDVKIAALLSGGLDSSSITALASSWLGENFESFSVISRNEKFSEESFIDVFLRHNHIKNTKIYFDSPDIIQSLEEVLSHQDEPFASFSVISQYELFKAIRRESEISVILSGQGGDEVLMGYLKYFFLKVKMLLRKGKIFKAAREIMNSIINRTAVFQFNIAESRRYLPAISNIGINFIKKVGVMDNYWNCDDLTSVQKNDLDLYSVPILARYEDRNSMAHSIESRLPFLDHRLVNYLLNLSDDAKLKNGWSKYVLRKTMTELPDKIKWRRDKIGFITPEKQWLKHDLKPLIMERFNKSILAEMGFIDKKNFFEAYSAFLGGSPLINNYDISRVFIAEMWVRKFFLR